MLSGILKESQRMPLFGTFGKSKRPSLLKTKLTEIQIPANFLNSIENKSALIQNNFAVSNYKLVLAAFYTCKDINDADLTTVLKAYTLLNDDTIDATFLNSLNSSNDLVNAQFIHAAAVTDVSRAVRVFNSSKKSSLLNSSMLQVLAKSDRIKYAMNILDRVPKKDLTISDANAILMGSIDKDACFSNFQKTFGFEPQKSSINILLDFYSNSGNISKTNYYFSILESKENPDAFAWGSLLASYAVRNVHSDLDTLLNSFYRKKNMIIPQKQLSKIITCIGDTGITPALNLFYNYENYQNYTVEMVESLLQVYLKWGDVFSAWRLYRNILEMNTRYNDIVCLKLAQTHLNRHPDYLKDMIKFSGPISDADVLVADLIKALSKSGDKTGALEIFNQVKLFTDDLFLCKIAVLGCADYKTAVDIFNDLDLSEVDEKTATNAYRGIISACVDKKDKLDWFLKYKNVLLPTDNAILEIVSSCDVGKDFYQELLVNGVVARTGDVSLETGLNEHGISVV